jgi:DNA-directed RNA polymerase sigma subunit (sigma70/sigma32)
MAIAKKKKRGETRSKESIEKYLEEIGNFSPLPPEREIELARRIRKGDEDALDTLVKSNLRFVISVAKEYQGQGLPLQDLISEGNWGSSKRHSDLTKPAALNSFHMRFGGFDSLFFRHLPSSHAWSVCL